MSCPNIAKAKLLAFQTLHLHQPFANTLIVASRDTLRQFIMEIVICLFESPCSFIGVIP